MLQKLAGEFGTGNIDKNRPEIVALKDGRNRERVWCVECLPIETIIRLNSVHKQYSGEGLADRDNVPGKLSKQMKHSSKKFSVPFGSSSSSGTEWAR